MKTNTIRNIARKLLLTVPAAAALLLSSCATGYVDGVVCDSGHYPSYDGDLIIERGHGHGHGDHRGHGRDARRDSDRIWTGPLPFPREAIRPDAPTITRVDAISPGSLRTAVAPTPSPAPRLVNPDIMRHLRTCPRPAETIRATPGSIRDHRLPEGIGTIRRF